MVMYALANNGKYPGEYPAFLIPCIIKHRLRSCLDGHRIRPIGFFNTGVIH